MTQATRVRLLWPALLLAALFLSGWFRGRPEEPAGQPTSLAPTEVAMDLPRPLIIWGGWHRKGDRYVAQGEIGKAIFCYHMAEESFPSERPEFPLGSDWNERQWSGKPVRTYLAKALLYALIGENEACDYYTALGQSLSEAPSDDLEVARVRAFQAFQNARYGEVAGYLSLSEQPLDRLLADVALYKAGDKAAASRIRDRYKEIKAREGLAYLLAWMPAGVKATAESLK